jgi:hypothetical protein
LDADNAKLVTRYLIEEEINGDLVVFDDKRFANSGKIINSFFSIV